MAEIQSIIGDVKMETLVFIVEDDGSFVLETKLNATQFLLEYMDEDGNMKYFCTSMRSLVDYPSMYEYGGIL